MMNVGCKSWHLIMAVIVTFVTDFYQVLYAV